MTHDSRLRHTASLLAAVALALGSLTIFSPPAHSDPGQIHVSNQQELLDAITTAHNLGQPTEIIFDNDISVDQTVVIPSGTTATFTSNHQLEMTADTSTIEVEQGASLTIDGITVTADPGATGTGVVTEGDLVLASGTITGNTNTDDSFGGGVTIAGTGTFTMTGGTISGNTASNCGGGIYNGGAGSAFVLDGGTISGNTAGQTGGGVCNIQNATFTMNGGDISANVAQQYYGGGVSNTSGANFTMNGGTIDANTTVWLGGGGVFNNTTATFNLISGDIYDNVVGTSYVGGTAPNGGGVYNGSTGVMNMSGGNIYNNHSVSGGGVFNGGGTTSGIFNMSGGSITGNTASYPGGGVYNGGNFTMTAGDISGNTAAVDGGGAYNGASMVMSGGSITGNTSPNGGGIVNTSAVTSLIIGGTAVVANNTYPSGDANNITLPAGIYITLGDGSNGAGVPQTMSVGVAKTADNGVIVASGASASDTTYFTSDDPGLSALFDNGQIRLGNQPVTGVTLNRGTLNLTVGTRAALTATVLPTGATNPAVTWTSSDNYIAMVDASGTVTAVAAGSAVITVTTEDGNMSASCLVTVSTDGAMIITDVGRQRIEPTGGIPNVADNSVLKYFPPIASQGAVASCTTFSTIYYTSTYMAALARDIDVKAIGDSAIYSPAFAWIYGIPGSVTMIGSLMLDQWPWTPDMTQDMLGSEQPTPEMLQQAYQNRAESDLRIDDPSTAASQSLIKQYLANGYVFVGAIDMGALSYHTINDNPNSTADDSEVGKQIVTSDASSTPDHSITVVGYNDDIWFDANGDGVVQPDELGAYKIANSWGTTYGNDGFIWLTYSSAPALWGYLETYIFADTPHVPLLLGQFDITEPSQNGLVYLGWSPVDDPADVKYDVYNPNDVWKPTGSGTWVVDFSDVITQNGLDLANQSYDFYIRATPLFYDDTTKTMAIDSYELTDANGSVLATYAGSLPVTVDGPDYMALKITYGNTAVPATLDSIAVSTPPTTTSYTLGDALDLTGLAVTATYSDGSSKDVSASVTTDPPAGAILSTVGNQTVTVSYTENGTSKTATFTATVAAPACVGVNGSLTSNDSLVPGSGNGGYDATHYNIDLTYQPPVGATPATINATTTINAAVTGAPLCSFGLDLLGLTVSSVTVNGSAASFDRIQDAATNMYKLVVSPTTAVSGNFTVAVTYSGTPQQFTFAGSSNFAVGWMPDRAFTVGGTSYPADGGGVGLGEPVGAFAWYPVNATPTDKASYTTSLTAPNEFSAVAIGSLVSTTAVGADQTRWTWDEPDAVPSSFTIAAIGTYQADTDIHTTPGGTVVPTNAYTDPALINGGQVPAHYIDLTKQLLDWGENYFGPYQPAVAGYIMKPISVSYALEVYGKPFYTADWGDSTYIHEFAHQWGGNSVSVADWSDLWLAEGFATYMPWLWNEDHGGATVNDQALAVYNLPDTNSLWSVAPAGMTSQSQMFGNWNYDGGALALAALRQGIGADLMQQVMYDWFTQNSGGNASTQDFIELAESVTGADLTQWAHDYLYTAGKPPSWPAPLSYLPQTSMNAQILSVAFDSSSAGDSPVTYQPGDPAPTVPADQTFWFSIGVQNTGTSTWGQDSAAGQMPASFLSRDPDYNTTFGTFFMSPYQGQNVAPGDSFTYKTGLRAPSTPGTYTMTWQLAEWTTLIDGTTPYASAPFFGPQVTFTINVVARTDSPPTTVKQPGVVDASDFEYVGSFALPPVPGTDPPDEKTFFTSGITLRTVDGEQRMILGTGTYGQSLYEVAVPTPGKVVGDDFSAVPQAALRNVFGTLPITSNADSNGTMWYDQSTDTLYWTNYAWYMTGGLDFPVLQAGSLDSGTLTRTGQWNQPDDLNGAPLKAFWGGVTGIPQDFADEYTGGRTLGLGFGGQYSINASVSWGPAIAAVALPLTGTTMDEVPIFNYSISDPAPRDGNYFNVAPQPTSPWVGTSTMNDGVGSGVFIDLPDKKGYVTFLHEGIDRIAYDYGGPTWNSQWQNVWNVYSYDSLGQAATGVVPRESVVPSSVGYVTLPNDSATNAFQRIAGSAFDPATRLLYVYSLGAEPAGVAGTLYDQPLVDVYYVSQDLAFASPTVTKTIGDAPFVNTLTSDPGDVVTFTSSNPAVATVDASGQVTIVGVGNTTITASAPAKTSGSTASYTLMVTAKNLSTATVTAAGPVAFTGAALTPAVAVSLGGVSLIEGQDYTVTYADNTNAGTATVTVTGRGNYTGTASGQFTIAPRVITFSIDSIPDQQYTSQAITPSVVVRDSTTPVPTQGYTASYVNNVDVGTATVNITGIGNYAGSTGSTSFNITTTAPPAQDQTLVFDSPDVTKIFGDPAFTNQLTHTGDGTLSFTSTNPAVATVDSNGLVTILAAGSTSITVVAAAVPDQWLETSASYTLTIASQSLTSANVSLPAAIAYTGGPLTPALTVTIGGQTLVQGQDFTVTYTDNTGPGEATVTINGIGNYAGQVVSHFTITPLPPTLSLTTTTWPAPAKASSLIVAVTTNQTSFAATSDRTWLTVTVNGATVSLSADANPTGLPRTATVTVQAGGLQATVSVTQAGVGSATVSHNGASVTTVQTGWTVVGMASGFQPGESVKGSMHSLPLDLGTQIADANGQVQFTWMIPDDTPAGAHTFVATGTTLTMQAAFTVPSVTPAPAPASGGTSPAQTSVSITVQTGGSMMPNFGGWALMMLISAMAVLSVLWRRHPST